MSSLNVKSFTELVGEQVTAIQARAAKLVDFSIGSILRSLAESNAGVVMWLQQLIVKLLVTTRAATCSGEDLDSWMADFGFFRRSAVQATGNVTFSRLTPASQALITVGTKITTLDGTQSYTVIADQPGQSGYIIAAGVISLEVPVRADTAGAAGNAQPGTVTLITGSVLYVDKVTNPAAFVGGQDAESDDDFRARFRMWIASLSKATRAAIAFALSNVQRGVSYTLTENVSWDGRPQPGYFYAVIDDGSGMPPRELLDRAYRAIDAVRGFTITFGVFRPVVIYAKVILSFTTDNEADHSKVAGLIEAAVSQYIADLHPGQLLAYTRIIRVAYAASPLVTNVTYLTLNDGKADLAASSKQVIRKGQITVS